MRSVKSLAVLCLFVSIMAPLSARAQCSATIAMGAVDQNGNIPTVITAIGGDCGDPKQLFVTVDNGYPSTLECTGSGSCSVPFTIGAACMPAGTHHIYVHPQCQNYVGPSLCVWYNGTDTAADFTVDNKPTATLTMTGFDDQATSRVTISGHFPNSSGQVRFFVDGNVNYPTWGDTPVSTQDYSFPFLVTLTCATGPHTFQAVAFTCPFSPPYPIQSEPTLTTYSNIVTQTVVVKPSVSIVASPSGDTGNTQVGVVYGFPMSSAATTRFVEARADGGEVQRSTVGAQYGTFPFSFSFNCAPGTHTLWAHAYSCSTSDPNFSTETTTTYTVSDKPSITPTYDDTAKDLKVYWTFPDTEPSQRAITYSVDGGPFQETGSNCVTVNPCVIHQPFACGTGNHHIRVMAYACGRTTPESTDDKTVSVMAPDDCDSTHCCPIGCTAVPDLFSSVNLLGSSGAGGGAGACVASPINLGSGDVSLHVPLFTISQSPLPLRMSLAYHSNPLTFPGAAFFPMGYGWTHSFNMSMRFVGPHRLMFNTGTGDRAYFDEDENNPGTWLAARPGTSLDKVTEQGSTFLLTTQNGDQLVFRLDSVDHSDVNGGRWLSAVDRWANTITGAYDSSGNLSTLTDSEGRVVSLTYNGTNLTQITTPDGGVWRFTYGSLGLDQIFDPLHTASIPWRTFSYNSQAGASLLTAMRDESGALLEGHAYDGNGRGVSSFAGGGSEQFDIEYDTPSIGLARVTQTIPGGTNVLSVYSLDYKHGVFLPTQIQGICASCGSSSDTQSFQYDELGHVTSKTDGVGHVTQYTWGTNGNLSTVTEAAGTPVSRTKTFLYEDPSWQSFVTTMTETSATGGVHTIQRSWNSDKTVLTTTETGQLSGSGSTTTYTRTTTFDTHHRVISDRGPRTDVTDVTSRAYYPDGDAVTNRRGRLQQVVSPVGLTTSFDSYDLFGTPQTTTDPNGVITERQPDLRGRVVSTISHAVPGDSNESTDYVSTSTFDGRDRLTGTTTARGTQVRFGYEDGTNRLVDTIRLDSNGNEVERRHLTLDSTGAKVKEEDQSCAAPSSPCSSWTTVRSEQYVYDDKHRLSEIDHPTPAGSKVVYHYDADGKLISVQDENHAGANTTYSYDALDRLASVSQTLATAPGGVANTSYGYDAQDNLTSVTDPNGNVTTYAYDDFKRMQRQTSPVTGVTSYSYDPSGNLISTTDANGATTARVYDAANRVTSSLSSRSGASSEALSWTYDDSVTGHYGHGRLSSMTDPSGSTVYQYERRGLLRNEQKTIGTATYTTSFGYDADGNRGLINYPSGRTVHYTFDYANRPYGASSGSTIFVASAGYMPFGPQTQILFGNGTAQTMQYDARYRPLDNKLTGPSGTMADYAYAEDPLGNITQIHDATDATYNRDFGYDDLNRLVTANSGSSLWGAGSYTYDAMGNMLSLGLGTSRTASMAYSGTTPKLMSVTENGATRAVSYDAAGNESTVGTAPFAYSPRNQLTSATNVTYTYDGRGVRAASSYPPYAIASVSVAPSTLYTNQSATGTVTLAAAAPAGGALVQLSSSTTSVSVPASVTVPAGGTTATFGVSQTGLLQPGPATITATYVFSRATTLALATGPSMGSLSVTPATLAGGGSAQATITLAAAAPAGGAPVTVSSSATAATVPAVVTVSEGQAAATFTVNTTPVTASTPSTLTASYNGTATTTLTINPPSLVSLILTPTSVIGGRNGSGTVTLNGPAAAATTVTLASSNTSAATVPASVTIAAGASSATFAVSTAASVSSTITVTMTATLGSQAQTAMLTITACVPLTSPQPTIPSGDTVWIDDSLPSGASLQNNSSATSIHWDTSQAASGTQSLVSNYAGSGITYKFFVNGLSQPVAVGENLVFYIRSNECAPPRELLIRWYNTTTTYSLTYWGAAVIGGESGGYNMGALPVAGGWTRVQIPASQLRMEQSTVTKLDIEYSDGQMWFDHFGKSGSACIPATSPQPTIPAGDTVWIDDALPSGASLQNNSGSWVTWDTSQAASGMQSLTKFYLGSGINYTFFINGLSQPVAIGENLVFYVRLNECAPPRELLIRWYNTTTGFTLTYWGAAVIGGESGGYNLGALPAAGGWARIQIPASQLQMEESTVTRLDIEYADGQIWFDHFGKSGSACVPATSPAPTIPAGDSVWIDDSLPSGATLQNNSSTSIHWDTSQAASGTQSLVSNYLGAGIRYNFFVNSLSQPLGTGESLVFYVRPNECATPRELFIRWYNTKTTYTITYWGAALIGGESGGFNMGALPATGGWTRIQIPASQLGMEGGTVTKLDIEYVDGQIWFDHFGKRPACTPLTAARPTIPSGDTVWIDDSLPSGASLQNIQNTAPRWDTAQAASGTQSLTTNYLGSGYNFKFFVNGLSQPVAIGENLVFYMLLNDCPPRELLIRWYNTNTTYTLTYWGAAVIGGESGGINMGPLPAPGSWIRIQIPASQLQMEESTVTKLDIEYADGQIWFDHIGKSGAACVPAASPQPTIPTSDTVWVDDSLPTEATLQNNSGTSIRWDTSQAASGTQSLVSNYLGSGRYNFFVNGLSQPINAGESLVFYVRPNECATPRELFIRWYNTKTTYTVTYWGTALIGGESGGYNMGALPAAGGWTRIQIPASQLGMEGGTVTKVDINYVDGQIWFDHFGKTSAPAPAVLTGFTADHTSPQAAGTAITWTATATATVPPAQFRFERQDNGTWSVVQAYGSANAYSWTPASSDAGDHAVRVSVRNSGSIADFEDTRTLAMTITSGMGTLAPRPGSLLARFLDRFRPQPQRIPLSLSVSARYATSAVGDLNRYSLYTPELNLMSETETSTASTPAVAYDYIWFGGKPVAQVDVATSTTHWTFTDHLGTPILQTNATGAIDWRAEYEPFGSLVTLRTGPTRHQPLRFPGQESDAVDGEREYNIFRWYRGGWGRYSQADPKGLRGSWNLYAYVADSPVNTLDPLGLQLYKPRYPPNQPPANCTASPWQFVTNRTDQYGRARTIWKLVSEEPFEIASEEPEGHTGIICKCEYELAGVEKTYQASEQFQRTITCCGQSANQRKWFRRNRWTNVEPVIGGAKKITIAPYETSLNSCLCPPFTSD
jgi:RHS repeat-associated protein